MTDKDHSSDKPSINGADNPPNGSAAATTAKPGLRNPPYRPQPQHQHQHRRSERRSRRGFCCRCCFWTVLVVLVLILVVAIAGISFYLLYRPHRPQFSISSLRIARLNLTSGSDSSSPHLSSLLNLTFSSHNSNSRLSFFYDPFSLSCFSGSVFVANGSVAGFNSEPKSESHFRSILAGSEDLDDNSATSFRSNLGKKGGISLRIEMETKVKVKMGKLKSKKLDLRVTCEGIKAEIPKGNSPTSAASVSEPECEIGLRLKIWNWRI